MAERLLGHYPNQLNSGGFSAQRMNRNRRSRTMRLLLTDLIGHVRHQGTRGPRRLSLYR